MKKCNGCLNSLEESCFTKDKSKSDGLRTICKTCDCSRKKARYVCNPEKNRENYKKNKEVIKARAKQYSRDNRSETSLRSTTWRKENPEATSVISKKYRDNNKPITAQYRKDNRAKYNAHGAKHRAAVKKATLECLTEFDYSYIEHLYIQAKELESLDGIKRHVDHIIPLRGKDVCGLHVPWNLQILTETENLMKGNRIK